MLTHKGLRLALQILELLLHLRHGMLDPRVILGIRGVNQLCVDGILPQHRHIVRKL